MRRLGRAGVIAMTAALGTAMSACSPGEAPARAATATQVIEPFSFGVVGDVPYGEQQTADFPRLVDDIEGAGLAWLIHVGDFKAGSTECSDGVLRERVEAIDAIDLAVVYLPGDNEWTDCHRPAAGRYDPLDRLAFLRSLAYPRPGTTLGRRPLVVESQATEPGLTEFPEHQRWSRSGVVFTTVHVVGSANGLVDFPGRTSESDAEVARRIDAAVAWLDSSFAEAVSGDAAGMVVVIHANPLDPEYEPKPGSPPPYRGFISALRRGAERFGKPVLLVHGDTHEFRIDRPLRDGMGVLRITNLVRLEGFGAPDFGWVEVQVDPADPAVFRFVPRALDTR